MTDLHSLKQKWLTDPKVKREFDNMAFEFEIAEKLITARNQKKLSQKELAKRMGTTQSVVARLESGQTLPSLSSILRYATAMGFKPHIYFDAT